MTAGSPIPVTSQIAMSTLPVLIAAADINRRFLQLFPMTASVDVFIGGTTVLSSTSGFPIPGRTPFSVDNPLTTGAIYGLSTAAQTVATIKW